MIRKAWADMTLRVVVEKEERGYALDLEKVFDKSPDGCESSKFVKEVHVLTSPTEGMPAPTQETSDIELGRAVRKLLESRRSPKEGV